MYMYTNYCIYIYTYIYIYVYVYKLLYDNNMHDHVTNGILLCMYNVIMKKVY